MKVPSSIRRTLNHAQKSPRTKAQVSSHAHGSDKSAPKKTSGKVKLILMAKDLKELIEDAETLKRQQRDTDEVEAEFARLLSARKFPLKKGIKLYRRLFKLIKETLKILRRNSRRLKRQEEENVEFSFPLDVRLSVREESVPLKNQDEEHRGG